MTRTVNRIHRLNVGPCYEVREGGMIVDLGWISMERGGLFAAHSNRPPHTPFAFGVDVDRVIDRMREPVDTFAEAVASLDWTTSHHDPSNPMEVS